MGSVGNRQNLITTEPENIAGRFAERYSEAGQTPVRSIPASNVSVNGEDNYRFTNGRRPSGTGNWAFNIGGEEVFIYGSYSEAKKEARRRAARSGIGSIRLLT